MWSMQERVSTTDGGEHQAWDRVWQATTGDERELFHRGRAKSLRQLWLGWYADDVWELMGRPTKGNCVELGAGRGTMSKYLASHGCDVTLVDLSPNARLLAEASFAKDNLPPPRFVEADVRDTGIPDSSVDCVLSIGLLEHFHDPAPVLAESVRILRPGGLVFHVIVPSVPLERAYFAKALFAPWRVAGSEIKRRLTQPTEQSLLRTPYGAQQYAQWMVDAGARDVDCMPYNGYHRVYGSMLLERWVAVSAFTLHYRIRRRVVGYPVLRTHRRVALALLLTARKAIASSQNTPTPTPGHYSPPLLLKLVKLYDRHSPLRRGKRLLYAKAMKLQKFGPGVATVVAKPGWRFQVNLSDPIYRDLYFIGEYEPEVSAVVRQVLRSGDVALDIGANFGWFTQLFSRVVGEQGRVDSFEPVEPVYRELQLNLAMNGNPANVRLNKLALSDTAGTAVMHVFAGLNKGHSSMSDLGREDYVTSEAPMTTLDSYLAEAGRPTVTLLKCDVEGAEMSVLRGAEALLSSTSPPMLILEINTTTSAAFGYEARDMLTHLAERGYEFYRITRRGVEPLNSPAASRHGDNLLCAVPDLHRHRIASLLPTSEA